MSQPGPPRLLLRWRCSLQGWHSESRARRPDRHGKRLIECEEWRLPKLASKPVAGRGVGTAHAQGAFMWGCPSRSDSFLPHPRRGSAGGWAARCRLYARQQI